MNKKISLLIVLPIIIFSVIISIVFVVVFSTDYYPPYSPRMLMLNGFYQIKAVAEKFYSEEKSFESFSNSNNIKILADYLYKLSNNKLIVRGSKDKYCTYIKLISPEGNNYACLETDKDYIITDINPGSENYCDGKTFLCPQKNK
ncbi:MAG: hypothetical protein NTW46_01645 [Candidatus Nealsonbacteria bacterium]|nr:hypothetical protein [Candidatus Nealsonbacteria bacterium]